MNVFNAEFARFDPGEIENGIVDLPNKDKIKYEFAFRANNQFSIEFWTDYTIQKHFSKLYSISLYNVINLPFALKDRLTNEEVLIMLTDAYLHAFNKHTIDFKKQNKGNPFSKYEPSPREREILKENIKNNLLSAHN